MLALLHSYRNPAHEREAERLIGQWAPEMPVFCSSEVWPIIREYERTATATIHGYVQPLVARYLDGPADGPEAGRRRRRGHGDQVERRRHDRRARQVGLPADAAVGHRRRRHRRGLRGAPGRAGQGPEPRHRRHLGRCRHHRRRHAELRHRRDGRRLPDLHPDRFGDLDRRRRRLDRRGERVRHPRRSGPKARARRPARPATAAAARGPP